MTQHSYNSPEYFAQVFRNELKDYFIKKIGGGLPVTHSKNTISFVLEGITSHIIFDYKGKAPYMKLEMSLENSDDIKREKSVTRKLNIKRSKTGRISGSYPKLLEDFVLGEIKTFYNKWHPKH